MDLFLIRHAIAEERRAGLRDEDRVLTDVGRERFERVVLRLDGGGFCFDRVYHSPWVRAVQTAELLRPITDGPFVVADELAAPPDPAFLATLTGENVACVGHDPWISDTLALLTTGEPDGSWVRFKKGAVAWLRGAPAPSSMELRAFVPPRRHIPPAT